MFKATQAPVEEEEAPPPPTEIIKVEPRRGTVEWIYWWSETEGHLPTPINVSITGTIKYQCPELRWYNFEVFPHKIKMTNTGYTILIGAKWKTERPYLEGGPLLGPHVISQMHFHWGANMMEGSDHTVDRRMHPAELQCIFFRSEYMTQQEAMKHEDGCMVVSYIVKHAVVEDERMTRIIEGFPRIQEAQTTTRIGPYPMSQLIPMFYEDYFLYWGILPSIKGRGFPVRWVVPRITLSATFEQMKAFRKIWDPWDEPNRRNFRQIQPAGDRHIFFINPHWNQYNSLLPIPRIPEASISVLSPRYMENLWMLPPQNAYMLPPEEEPQNEEQKENPADKQ